MNAQQARKTRYYYETDIIDNPEPMASDHVPVQSGYFGTSVMLASMMVLALSVFSVWFLIDHQTQPVEKKMHVASVSFEEVLRPGNGKVVKVEGLVRNDTETPAPIKRVEIILRNSSGSEVGRWYHAPRMSALKPGKSMQFMSAVPVNAIVIASVEARLQ